MRTAKFLVAAGLMIAGLPSLAHAQWYVGADVGANYTQDASVSAGTTNNTTYNWGPVGLVEGGYSFGAPKLEAEVGYRSNGVGNVGSASGGGEADSLSLMVNGIYDFGGLTHVGTTWHPFVGVGVGTAKVTSNDISRSSTFAYSGNNWEFAYQGFAGVGYDVARDWMAKLQYRYFATADYGVNGAGGTSGNAEYKNHAVLVGLTYKFGAPAPAPVVEAAPAPVAAAPAPVPVKPAPMPRNYMVFFDFDKATITPEAAKIITEAAGAAKMGGVTRVHLTGHTDTVGSDKYNMALSLKRADAVKDAMVRQGVPADEIVVVGKGKTDLLVPTKDGVREPQNRRVEIVLQ
jgi:outer membrane protein OmpA-like peptidoglycan-associated protein